MKRFEEKPLVWIGTTLQDLRKFPKQVRCEIGYALDVAQNGGKADHVKPLKGIVTGSGILEVIERFDGDTYRAVYTVRLEGIVYALHAFKKKSKKDIKTPKSEIDLIKMRYKRAVMEHERRSEK